MTTNIFKSVLIVISVVFTMFVSGCAAPTPTESVMITEEVTEEVPTKVMILCTDEACKNTVRDITVSRNSPIWFMGERMPTVEEYIDEPAYVLDMSALYDEGGWGLEYGEDADLSFISKTRSSYRDSKVMAIYGSYTPYIKMELFNEYSLGYVKLGEIKKLLGSQEQSEMYMDYNNSYMYGFGNYFYFEGNPSERYRIDFYSESDKDSVEKSVCTIMYVQVVGEDM